MRVLFNFSESSPVEVLDSEKESVRWKELIGAMIALMIGLVSEDKGRDILAIDAKSTQISGILEFQLVKLWKLLPKN